jgi:hypothetical protein
MNAQEVVTVLEYLKSAHPRLDVGEDFIRGTIPVYVEQLGDLSFDLGMRAAKQCVRELKFFPTVAEIRKAAHDLCEVKVGELSPFVDHSKALPAEGETIGTAEELRAAVERVQDEWRAREINVRSKPWAREDSKGDAARARAERELAAVKGKLAPPPDARVSSIEPPAIAPKDDGIAR